MDDDLRTHHDILPVIARQV